MVRTVRGVEPDFARPRVGEPAHHRVPVESGGLGVLSRGAGVELKGAELVVEC